MKRMKDRIIDLSMLVGLGAIALVIAFTLLNLGRNPPERIAETSPASIDASPEPAIVAVPVRDVAPSPPEVEVVPEPDPLPAVPEPELAGGDVALERIGFSFVTGGAGACGITLEPWRHVAVSRELLAEYGCGAEVTLSLAEPVAGHQSFTAVIADTMSPSFTRTVNIYVATDEPALQYGLLDEGTLTLLEE